ncbi:hypothetical protein SUZIE_198005 [Sciurus carolinensis]|uniref:Uncharacterized protein n=1 Tax=Sciurus carolinensis TaxID=30640 RepID=A0AA41NDY1_SCICA|nr:hypothetical protein [Sciurus carolinensis]
MVVIANGCNDEQKNILHLWSYLIIGNAGGLAELCLAENCGHLLQSPEREAPREEGVGMKEDNSLLVEVVGETTQEVCPVTSV